MNTVRTITHKVEVKDVTQSVSKFRLTLSADVLHKSALNLYELAKINGFTGSLTDFLESLKVQGETGATYTPHIENGVLSWANDKGLDNPEPFVLFGEDDYQVIKHILNNG